MSEVHQLFPENQALQNYTKRLRSAAMELFDLIYEAPHCDERELALDRLEDCIMAARLAIYGGGS